MDIRDWPLGRIMQLPDCYFGRRFIISVMQEGMLPAQVYDISEIAFPETAVIWEIRRFYNFTTAGKLTWMRLSLGDKLPTTAAEFNALEPLIPHYGILFGGLKQIPNFTQRELTIANLKYPIRTSGRRLCLTTTGSVGAWDLLVTVVVSSIPTEIPDCLLSGVPKNLL